MPQDPLTEAEDRFVLEWGRMSSSWGINRTMAQIHALLLITARPMSMDEIIERLHISRGNASMNLRDLMDWGIVRRFRKPGDRRDIYICDSDAALMVARILRERKRREFDPTYAAIQDCYGLVPESDTRPEAEAFRERLQDLTRIFDIVNNLYSQVFKDDETFRQTLQLFEPKRPSSP